MKYKITPKSTFVNIRSDHSTTSTDIGDLLPAHFAEGDVLWMSGTIGTSNYQLWLNIQTLDGVAKSGWCAVWYQGTELCAMTENTPPPPPAETVVKVNLSAVVDGATYVPGSIAGNEVTMKKA